MPDTLEQLLGQVQSFKAGSDKATEQVIAALGAQAAISTSAADTYTQQGTDESTVQAAKNAADYQTQLSRVRAANIAGVNLKDQSEVLTALSAAKADAQTRKDEALAEIQKKDSVGFMDNPLEYIMNQFTINSDIAKHNIANAQYESAHTAIMNANLEAQGTIQTQNAISEPLTAASMEASARNAAVAANIAAKNAQIQALSYGTRGIEFALNASKETLALGFQEQSAKQAAIHTGIALQQLEQSKKEFAVRQEQWKQAKDDKEEQQQLGQSVLDTVNLGRVALLGPNAPALDDMNGKMMLAALKGKGELSVEMKKYYDAGERTKLAGVPIIGTTPAAAAATMNAVPVQLNSSQGPIKSLLDQAARDTRDAVNSVGDINKKNMNKVFDGLNPKDTDSINAAYNGRAQQLMDNYSSVINQGDSKNPNQVASINQLAQNSATVRDLPVVQKVLAPIMKAGTQLELNDPRLPGIIGDAVAKGVITHAQALELTTVAHVGVTANQAMRNFPGFGLTPSRSYNVDIDSVGVVDITKPDAWSRALMKMNAAKLSEQLSTGGANIFTGKSGNTVGTIMNNKGVDPDSWFQPQPQAAQDLSNWANDASAGMEGVMQNLPHMSPPTQQSASGKIKYPAKQ